MFSFNIKLFFIVIAQHNGYLLLRAANSLNVVFPILPKAFATDKKSGNQAVPSPFFTMQSPSLQAK